MLIEFAPYLPAATEALGRPLAIGLQNGYLKDRNSTDWEVTARVTRDVRLKVPAGELNTFRIELQGSRSLPGNLSQLIYEMGRFEMTAWYSSETRRVVRIENRIWYGNAAPAADELVELVEYSGT
jgi:hypothetical protein